ncbi:MAG: S-layer homology domain-containing protein [Clostridia bacterium]|nr:S-layer homology domain-containing protein [Clostridia bacterium]
MRMHKVTALGCALLLLCGMGVCANTAPYNREEITAHSLVDGENAQNILVNGGFEMLEAETKLQGWGVTPGNLGEGGVERAKEAHSGEYALYMAPKEGEARVTQSIAISRLNSGKICELSVWVKPSAKESKLSLIQTFGIRNAVMQDEVLKDSCDIYFEDAEPNIWTEKVIRFVLPDRITYTAIELFLASDESVLVDDISLLMEGAPPKVPKPTAKTPVLSDYEMVKNGSFEEGTVYWDVAPGQWDDFVSIIPEGENGNCAKIFKKPENAQKNPQLAQNIRGFEEGAEYQLHFRIKSPGVEMLSAVSYGFRWGNNGVRIQNDKTGNLTLYQNDTWQDIYLDSVCPVGANSCMIDFRHFSPEGYYLVDDVSVYMTKRAPYAEVETDEIFYYTEWKTGTVDVRDRTKDGILGNGRITLEIKDGEQTIYENEGNLANGNLSLAFPIAVLAEIGKEYTAHVTVYDAAGEQKEAYDRPIYRYNRPTYLGADGVFRKPDRNGVIREHNIVLGNGVNNEKISKVAPGGITVIQLVGGASLPLPERMDMAEKAGQLVLITLYSGKKSAGHPEMLPHTIDKVNLVKDHPALFGYKIQDEPMQKGNSDEELALAYKTIRDLDPHHPIYTDDSGYATYERMGKFCDYMDIDVYPVGSEKRASLLGDMMELAVKAVRGRKPVGLLQQAFEYGGTFPTADEFRHYAYQVLLSGASGFGYHSFGEATTSLSPEHPSWPGLCKMAEWEQGFMFDSFVNNKNPMLNEEKTDTVWWRTYILNNKIYVIILNRQAFEGSTANVKLTDFDGGLAAQGYTAKRIAGGEEETLTIDGTTFTKELASQAAYLYEITPNSPVDFSSLKTSKYRDLTGYNWAHSAIVNMENAGVVNDITDVCFAPREKITRGDFAYFMINALGLSGDATASFADVPEDAYYAKAIAVGKAHGILNGVGNNLFNPKDAISRQDIIAITARGMRKCKGLEEGSGNELAAYVDAGEIADYAVADVAAMVKTGIIKGESDRILNPLGLTTRAEAAVIANRIYSK